MSETLQNWSPPLLPSSQPLTGQWMRLEPLSAPQHGADLAQAFEGADDMWRYLPPEPPRDVAAVLALVAELAGRSDLVAYAVVDAADQQAKGFLTLMQIRPAHGVIEIGYVAFAPLMQRTRIATEAVYLAMRHCFDTGYRRVEWKCDNANAPSRRAAERFGFTFEGVHRQHMVRKGCNRDTAWFSLLDSEWPAQKARFAAWLASANFDAAGRQKQPLAAMVAASSCP